MAAFTYHKDSKTVSCVCGKEIYGEHTCNDILKVKECKDEDCTICEDKEAKRLFEDQWYEDRDGYSRCSTCGEKCYEDLPKQCNCNAYVDADGIEKCKSCDHPWGEKETEFDECNNCGYQGE